MPKRSISSCDQDNRDVFEYNQTFSEEEEDQIEEEETCDPNDEQSGTEWVFQGHLYLKTDNGTLSLFSSLISSNIFIE